VSGQLHAPAALPQGKSPWYPLDRKLGGPHSRSAYGGEKKNSQSLPGLKPPIIQPVAQRYEKVKLSLCLTKHYATKAYGERRACSTHFQPRHQTEASCQHPPPRPPHHQYPSDRRSCGPQSWYGRDDEEKIIRTVTGNPTPAAQPRSPVSTPAPVISYTQWPSGSINFFLIKQLPVRFLFRSVNS
jgi:hypothetical protein